MVKTFIVLLFALALALLAGGCQSSHVVPAQWNAKEGWQVE
jgi:hypothetical protein